MNRFLALLAVLCLLCGSTCLAEAVEPSTSTVTLARNLMNALIRPSLTLHELEDISASYGLSKTREDISPNGDTAYVSFENDSPLGLDANVDIASDRIWSLGLLCKGTEENGIYTNEDFLSYLCYQLNQLDNAFYPMYSLFRGEPCFLRWAPFPELSIWIQADESTGEVLRYDGQFSINFVYLNLSRTDIIPYDPITATEKLFQAFSKKNLTVSDLEAIAEEMSLVPREDVIGLDTIGLIDALNPLHPHKAWLSTDDDTVHMYSYDYNRLVVIARQEESSDKLRSVTVYNRGYEMSSGETADDLLYEYMLELVRNAGQAVSADVLPEYVQTAAEDVNQTFAHVFQFSNGITMYIPSYINEPNPYMGDFSMIFLY